MSASRTVSRIPVSKAAFCPALSFRETAPSALVVSLPLAMVSNLEIRLQLIFLFANGFPSGYRPFYRNLPLYQYACPAITYPYTKHQERI